MGKKTALYDQHLAGHAKLVDFFGWEMPLHYGSQVEEHHAVRNDAGMFDVSHMLVVDLHGAATRDTLARLLANDVGRLDHREGAAIYSTLLNDKGGVIDDLIAYRVNNRHYRLISNAGTRPRVLEWLRKQTAAVDVSINERNDLSIIAVQGPRSRDAVANAMPELADRLDALKPFHFRFRDGLFVARTGYTGEDGFELVVANDRAAALWQRLVGAGVAPCGLGARDTLRLEAGMNLHGHEMDESVSPLQANLEWTVAWEPAERDFIGRAALEKQRGRKLERLRGLVLEERGIPRAGQTVHLPGLTATGVVTSGSWSPTLECGIALARLPADADDSALVEVRGKLLHCRIVSPPFVRNGKIRVSLNAVPEESENE